MIAHPADGVAAGHSTLVIAGWSDASSGPLIPYIQQFYGISYTIGKYTSSDVGVSD